MRPGEQVEVRMGISYVGYGERPPETSMPSSRGRSFDAIRERPASGWNDLGRIRVEGGTEAQQRVFYTGVYHALIHPNLVSDVNGEYPLMERSGSDGRRWQPLYGLLAGIPAATCTSC